MVKYAKVKSKELAFETPAQLERSNWFMYLLVLFVCSFFLYGLISPIVIAIKEGESLDVPIFLIPVFAIILLYIVLLFLVPCLFAIYDAITIHFKEPFYVHGMITEDDSRQDDHITYKILKVETEDDVYKVECAGREISYVIGDSVDLVFIGDNRKSVHSLRLDGGIISASGEKYTGETSFKEKPLFSIGEAEEEYNKGYTIEEAIEKKYRSRLYTPWEIIKSTATMLMIGGGVVYIAVIIIQNVPECEDIETLIFFLSLIAPMIALIWLFIKSFSSLLQSIEYNLIIKQDIQELSYETYECEVLKAERYRMQTWQTEGAFERYKYIWVNCNDKYYRLSVYTPEGYKLSKQPIEHVKAGDYVTVVTGRHYESPIGIMLDGKFFDVGYRTEMP